MRFVLGVVFSFIWIALGHAQRSIDFDAAPQPDDALVFAVSDVEALDGLGAIIGEAGLDNVRRAIAASAFEAETGSTASFISGTDAYGEIHLVAIAGEGMRPRDWEDFGGRASVLARATRAERVTVLAPGADNAAIVSAAFGAAIGQYSFDKYKSDATPITGDLVFIAEAPDAARSAYQGEKAHVANAVNWARDMQSEPANVIYPEEFVRRARAAFRGVPNVTISVLDERDMERLGMGAILGVGKGSVRPPRIMITRYNGGAAGDAPMVYAGKGITFDTGGISLKSNNNMWQMKADMTGAATVTAAVMGLAKSRAPVNVIAVAALAENMPDGGAQRPGDVVKTMSGTTVEIMSTDAEGRLVLSDAVWYAQEQFNPSLLVDVATLTGSVGRALGDEYGGLFAREDAIAERLLAAGEASGEDLWRLPLHPNHKKQIKSLIADIKNGDTGAPGASTGATFIGTFVKEETPWAHLDIAGIDWLPEPTATVPIGASGFSVRLLDRLARDGQ
ncbi:MAG: leucyl aminopeptidase [Pseudomonadota bacterium]